LNFACDPRRILPAQLRKEDTMFDRIRIFFAQLAAAFDGLDG
jgi:hypothetical protein